MAAIALLAWGASALAAPPAPAACDAGCLTDIAGRYMAALAAKRAADLPWAERVRYSENGVPMMIGDGLWGTVTKVSDRPLVVTDPASGNVAWIGVVEEHGQPGFQAMRLRVAAGRISEIEVVTRRKEGRPPFGDPVTFAHDSAFSATLPTAARIPRTRMIALVRDYLSSGGPAARFAADCKRIENGLAAQGCGVRADVDKVRGLRFPVVDAERGIVVAVGDRDHSARDAVADPKDAAPLVYPRSEGFIAVFRLSGGAIERIEDYAVELPYLMPTWQE